MTPIDVFRAAAKYLADDNLCVIAIGPARAIGPILSRYGTVGVVDERGRSE